MDRPAEATPRIGLWFPLGLTYVLAGVVMTLPAVFLASGIQAIGRARGWWLGDSNANDGEEVLSTVIGSIGAVGVLSLAGVMAVVAAHACGRSEVDGIKGALVGSAAVVLAQAVLMTLMFAR